MTDPKQKPRTYVVLALVRSGSGDAPTLMGYDIFAEVARVEASGADVAIAEAVGREGLPRDSSGVVIAVPETNWNARMVTIRQQPVVDVGPLEASEPAREDQ